ncbi:MAG: hypothetical protein JKX78_03665 [Alteromonadaceae bacterium]|nr:hypothetical protein [Alteromonadaceae bacterium]MBL4909050.1 hypothetical protein [Alteromonadaceae bacterium]MBL4909116.1 hypothetical protein [Alteromonadaceae bacterium]
MSSIFRATFTTVNGNQNETIYIGTEEAVQVEADSEVSRYGCRGVTLEHVGHSQYIAKEGDSIVVVGG